MTELEVREKLQAMSQDKSMNTRGAYSPNAALYPNGKVPFVEVHINYLKTHKNVDPKNYLSNLRLMIKARA